MGRMGIDLKNVIDNIKSHPDKLLKEHITGILSRINNWPDKEFIRAAVIFHDLGKMNPHFQKKVKNESSNGYSHHSYLSVFAWLNFVKEHQDLIGKIKFQRIDIIGIAAIIAYHHGDLPDFKNQLLKEHEIDLLVEFGKENPFLPISEFLQELKDDLFFPNIKFRLTLSEKVLHHFRINLKISDTPEKPLEEYFKIKFAFSSLIQADKADAGHLSDEINLLSVDAIDRPLNNWLTSFQGTTPLNSIRDDMRNEAVEKIKILIDKNPYRRTFSLTAPTGAGKTAMLLSIANELIQKSGPLKIIYILPFLSITEQVFSVCKAIWNEDVHRIDSKAQNFTIQKIQEQLEERQDSELLRELFNEDFSETTFNYPIIITTFVQFFETLLSNKNSNLLKFSNFANSIFLIDEIQALPPRLYTFFVAFLDVFARKFNSFAIVSTATMPSFVLPQEIVEKNLFANYEVPPELLRSDYFNEDVFNRYIIKKEDEDIDINTLTAKVMAEERSVLIILNTVKNSKDLFNALREKAINTDPTNALEIVLLNSLFTPNDRQSNTEKAKMLLKGGKRVILVSTQLIEAGVDIDFPVVYRDMCPLPSLIQSAGRCNRNNNYPGKGKVVLFELVNNGKPFWSYIYKGLDKNLVEYTRTNVKDNIGEPQLFAIQKQFFSKISEETHFGYHEGSLYENKHIFLVKRIEELAFEEIGKFRLIDKEHGEERTYYVLKDANDDAFNKLKDLVSELMIIDISSYSERKSLKIKIAEHMKSMAGNLLRVRIKQNEELITISDKPVYGINLLAPEQYNSSEGLVNFNGFL